MERATRSADPAREHHPGAERRRVEAGRPRPTAPSARTVLALQRGAGNAAVSRMLGAPRCPDVQRSVVDDAASAAASVVPAGVVGSLERLRGSLTGVEQKGRQEGQRVASETEAEVGRTPEQLQSALGPVATEGSRTLGAHGTEATTRAASATSASDELEQRGQRSADAIAGAAAKAAALTSPGRALIDPAATAATGASILDTVGAAATLDGPGGAGGSAPPVPVEAGDAVWSCDLAEIVAAVDGLAHGAVVDAVGVRARPTGPQRLAAIGEFGTRLNAKLGAVSGQWRSRLAGLSSLSTSAIARRVGALAATVDGARTRLDAGVEGLRRGLSASAERTAQRVAGAASQMVDAAGQRLGGLLQAGRGQLADAGGQVRRLLGGLGSAALAVLPGPLKGLADAAPAATARLTGALSEIGPRLKAAAGRAKDAVLRGAKAFADATLQQWAAESQLMRKVLDVAKKGASAVASVVSGLVPPRLTALAAEFGAAVSKKMGAVLRAADRVGAKVRDAACVALGAVGGPCVTQYLPEIGDGVTNSVRVFATGDLLVPLEGCTLKIGAGAAVEIAVADGVYTVKVSGEGRLYVNETVGGGARTETDNTLPAGSAGHTAAAWNALAGGPGPAAPGGPAAGMLPASLAGPGGTGTPAGPAANSVTAPGTETGGGDVGAGTTEKASLNAGLRGSTESTWRFDAKAAPTTCTGVGGMLTLLAGLGVSQVLPAPLNTMAGAGTQRGFMDQLQHCRFSVGLAGSADADLALGGAAALKLRGGAELMENVEVRRDAANNLVMVRNRTITVDLDGTAKADFGNGTLAALQTYFGAAGILRLTLTYEPGTDDILPSAVGGAIRTTVGAANFDPKIIAGLFPERVAGEVRTLLDSGLPGMRGPREAALSLTVGRVYEHLEPLGTALREYFAGPIPSITVDGVAAIVKRHLAMLAPIDHAKIELSQTQRVTHSDTLEEGTGPAAGGEGTVGAEHSITKTWWTASGSDELVEIAARRGKSERTKVEPPKEDKKGRQGRTSRYVYPGTLDLRPAYYDIREWFYKKGFRWSRKDKVIEKAAKGMPPGWYRCPGHGAQGPHRIRYSQITLDHITPVATQWNRTGFRTDQAARYDFYDDPGNLRVMCGPCNSAKGSGGIEYRVTVGERFRGWLE